jgi:hypothetical protein
MVMKPSISNEQRRSIIRVRNTFEIAVTDKPIPLKLNGKVDYEEYIKRIQPVKINRDLTQIY